MASRISACLPSSSVFIAACGKASLEAPIIVNDRNHSGLCIKGGLQAGRCCLGAALLRVCKKYVWFHPQVGHAPAEYPEADDGG